MVGAKNYTSEDIAYVEVKRECLLDFLNKEDY